MRGELSLTTDDFKPRWLPLPEGRFQLWFTPGSVDYRKQADVVTKRSTNKPGYRTRKRSELPGPYRERAAGVVRVAQGGALGGGAEGAGEVAVVRGDVPGDRAAAG